MDIQKLISDIVAKIGGDKSLINSFLSDPAKAIKDLLHIDVNADQISEIVSGVTKMLGEQAGEIANGGLLDKIKSFFKHN